jgi:hypothetical protein
LTSSRTHGCPNIYTVPFLDGHMVYTVLEWKGLVGILRYDP